MIFAIPSNPKHSTFLFPTTTILSPKVLSASTACEGLPLLYQHQPGHFTASPSSQRIFCFLVGFPGRSWCSWSVARRQLPVGTSRSCFCALPHFLLLESHGYEWTGKEMSIEPHRDGAWFSSCCLDISQVYLRASGYVKKTFIPLSLNLHKKA